MAELFPARTGDEMMTTLIGGPALGMEAVRLTPDAPWDEIAAWCYGAITNYRDDSGKWHTYIAIPQVEGEPLQAREWDWLVRYPDGAVKTFRDEHMPERALYPELWRKLVGDHGDCAACRGDENIGCRDRHNAEHRATWATRVVAGHLGLKPETSPC